MAFLVLSDDDKVEIRHHAGYPGVGSIATSILGNPASLETFFILELALNQIRPEAETRLRMFLATLDTIESQMIDDLELLAVTAVEEISIRKDEQAALVDRYLYWVDAMCNLIGIDRYPFDRRFLGGAANGINVRVHG